MQRDVCVSFDDVPAVSSDKCRVCQLGVDHYALENATMIRLHIQFAKVPQTQDCGTVAHEIVSQRISNLK